MAVACMWRFDPARRRETVPPDRDQEDKMADFDDDDGFDGAMDPDTFMAEMLLDAIAPTLAARVGKPVDFVREKLKVVIGSEDFDDEKLARLAAELTDGDVDGMRTRVAAVRGEGLFDKIDAHIDAADGDGILRGPGIRVGSRPPGVHGDDDHKHRVIRMRAPAVDEDGIATGPVQVDQMDLECEGMGEAVTQLLGGEPEKVVPHFIAGGGFSILYRGNVRLNVYADGGEPEEPDSTAAGWIEYANKALEEHPEAKGRIPEYVLATGSAN